MNIKKAEKIYQTQYNKIIEQVKQEITIIFKKYDFSSQFKEYEITAQDFIQEIMKSIDTLKEKIILAIQSKDKDYLSSVQKGFNIEIQGKDTVQLLINRVFGKIVVNQSGNIILPTNFEERLNSSNYIRDKNFFGKILDEKVAEAVQEGDVKDLLYSVIYPNDLTEKEAQLAFPYVLNKIIKQMQKQVDYELTAKQKELPSVEPAFNLPWTLEIIREQMGAKTDINSKNGVKPSWDATERNEEFIEMFKKCSAAPRLKSFIDDYFSHFANGDIKYDIFKTTAYIESADKYVDVFYAIDMLSEQDWQVALQYRNTAFQMKGDDRRGSEPNPNILRALQLKEQCNIESAEKTL